MFLVSTVFGETMVNESGGGAVVKPRIFQPKICNNVVCSQSFVPTNSRRKTCFDCSPLLSAVSSAGATKRDSSAISPIGRENGRPRRSSASDLLSYDIDLLENMTREELIVEIKAILDSCNRDFLKCKENIVSLEAEVEYQTQDCTDLKIIAADKDLKIFALKKELSELRSNVCHNGAMPPLAAHSNVVSLESSMSVQADKVRPTSFASAVSAGSKPVANSKAPDFASQGKQVTKHTPAPIRFVIIAKVAANTDLSGFNRKYFENLVDFKNNGPVVKSFRIKEGKVIIDFLDKPQCDDALNRIKLKPDLTKYFTDVYIPSPSFPAIVDMYQVVNLDNYPSRGDDLKSMKAKEKILIDKLIEENPSMADHILNFHILKIVREEESVLARIVFKTSDIRDHFVSTARLFLDNISHRVSKVNVNKEVRRCVGGCQAYGHSKFFCPTKKIVCGICALDHDTLSCKTESLCCANCKGEHEAGFHKCPAQIKAVKNYVSRSNGV